MVAFKGKVVGIYSKEKKMNKLLIVVSSLVVAVQSTSALTLDFEIGQAGDEVDFQYGDVIISGSADNVPMLFDTANPTGGDLDLSHPSIGLGLIISEDNNPNNPDDNADGGTIRFDFLNPYVFGSIELLDIEESGGTVDTYSGGNLVESLPILAGENNGLQTLLASSTMVIDRFDVNFEGSGLISEAILNTPKMSEEVPEPATVALLGLGLIGLAVRKKKFV